MSDTTFVVSRRGLILAHFVSNLLSRRRSVNVSAIFSAVFRGVGCYPDRYRTRDVVAAAVARVAAWTFIGDPYPYERRRTSRHHDHAREWRVVECVSLTARFARFVTYSSLLDDIVVFTATDNAAHIDCFV